MPNRRRVEGVSVMLKITGQMTRLPLVLGVSLTATRARPSQTPVGAGPLKAVLFMVWAHEGEILSAVWLADQLGYAYATCNNALRVLTNLGLIRVVRKTQYNQRAFELDITGLKRRQLSPEGFCTGSG